MGADRHQRAGAHLVFRSAVQFLLGLFGLGGILFVSAGSFSYWNAWLFLAAFFVPDLFLIIYLVIKDPEFLWKRLDRREKESIQKLFNALYFLIILTTMIISGLNRRYGWSEIPLYAVLSATVTMVLGFSLSVVAMLQNRYASRTVEIQESQKVIDTGLYSVIRHPMYLSALLFFCPMPLVLGSLHAFILSMAATPLLLIMRIFNEEKILREQLEGYEAYMQKVRYRLIPFLW